MINIDVQPMKNRRKLTSSLPLGICLLFSCNLIAPAAFSQNIAARIDLVVVEGEGAINNLRQRVTREPIVKVEDENHQPVAGAVVVFTLPISGATGEFSNGSKTLTVVTDKDGLAVAHGLKTNQVSGKLQIYVTASYRGLRARTLISQVNTGAPGASARGGGGKVWIILAVVGAAAAGGAVAATRGSSSGAATSTSATPAPIGVTPGTGTVTTPH